MISGDLMDYGLAIGLINLPQQWKVTLKINGPENWMISNE